MYPKVYLCLPALLMLCCVHVSAEDLALAVVAYPSGQYHQAYDMFNSLAQDQDFQAQYYLGLHHLNGHGVNKNIETGLSWLKKAAENGSYLAAAELGQIYLSGHGVNLDPDQAVKWITLSTELAAAEDADEACE